MNTTGIPTVAWICATALLVVILAGVFALAWHGSITGAAVVGVVTTIAAAALAVFGVHTGANAVINSVRANQQGQ
jgi:hypothetical protein